MIVAFDAARRVGRTTRFSLFIPLWLLEKAALTGWAEHLSTSDEPVVAFHPALFPIYVEMLLQGARVTAESIASVLDASGLVDTAAQPAEERARRAAMTLVRSAMFGKHVVEAYEGLCAMCGLNLGLCQGAHIYPASAPQSPDEVWNGLALCSNHHVAFDRHLVWVEPESRAVLIHPDVAEHAKDNKPSRIFLEATLSELREPNASVVRPRDEMFTQRYHFYEEKYEWAG